MLIKKKTFVLVWFGLFCFCVSNPKLVEAKPKGAIFSSVPALELQCRGWGPVPRGRKHRYHEAESETSKCVEKYKGGSWALVGAGKGSEALVGNPTGICAMWLFVSVIIQMGQHALMPMVRLVKLFFFISVYRMRENVIRL